MSRRDILMKRQVRLRKDIASMLNSFLIGTVGKSPSMTGHSLTTKVKGKTVTLYVRKDIVPKALEMGKRYKRLWTLIQALSKVNWELLNLMLDYYDFTGDDRLVLDGLVERRERGVSRSDFGLGHGGSPWVTARGS